MIKFISSLSLLWGIKFTILVIFSIALYKLLIYLINYLTKKRNKNTIRINNSYTGHSNMASSLSKRPAIPLKQEIHHSHSIDNNISDIKSVSAVYTQKENIR
ncbi:hypothetical protein HL033_01500 [Neoehrlichia mikurensis]|uniref:Uncharacterized protein n=1 Tax=Neoehrlichia mikurensis TaxID=89586 RepID=A0A9Q9F2Z5_9RICK|nr:hypothetical protein [Neoehrlichia mikurensis]QXK92221.1 hypothetical protein IAH97_01495 [Neoehrlichia mikurensis]QXK92676.1 hypothetical protein HUN61_01490 [Neoehrlichia mikurensis]QXK93914.1 hypothetical protein HL033_01500 [Neoehrlichia mikurensis]UTO55085.1 hypothetical protein LUA82_02615 [Neoehrlichia mikurensis]UTO56004.1 hypothetical protein LUA81_02595 [Neoehrlichia mikurensis]